MTHEASADNTGREIKSMVSRVESIFENIYLYLFLSDYPISVHVS